MKVSLPEANVKIINLKFDNVGKEIARKAFVVLRVGGSDMRNASLMS